MQSGPTDAINLTQIRRALVVKLRHHGDVLLSTPVYASLKKSIPGVEVHQEDNVVSIELPADELFRPGTQQLQPGGTALLDRVADAFDRDPLGIEGQGQIQCINPRQVCRDLRRAGVAHGPRGTTTYCREAVLHRWR